MRLCKEQKHSYRSKLFPLISVILSETYSQKIFWIQYINKNFTQFNNILICVMRDGSDPEYNTIPPVLE